MTGIDQSTGDCVGDGLKLWLSAPVCSDLKLWFSAPDCSGLELEPSVSGANDRDCSLNGIRVGVNPVEEEREKEEGEE